MTILTLFEKAVEVVVAAAAALVRREMIFVPDELVPLLKIPLVVVIGPWVDDVDNGLTTFERREIVCRPVEFTICLNTKGSLGRYRHTC